MQFILEDSALVKRYKEEIGTDVLDAVFSIPGSEIIVPPIALTEVFHAIHRLRKQDVISDHELDSLIGAVALDVRFERFHCYPLTLADARVSLNAVREAWGRAPSNGRPDSVDCLFAGWASAVVSSNPEESWIVICADISLSEVMKAMGLVTINPAAPDAQETLDRSCRG